MPITSKAQYDRAKLLIGRADIDDSVKEGLRRNMAAYESTPRPAAPGYAATPKEQSPEDVEAAERAEALGSLLGAPSGVMTGGTSLGAIEAAEREFPRPKPAPAARPKAREVEALGPASVQEIEIGEDEDPTEAHQRALGESELGALERAGLTGRDETLASASKYTDIYRNPEWVPPDAEFVKILDATRWEEPPIEIARIALKRPELTEDDPAYQRFADEQWAHEYDSARAEHRVTTRMKYLKSPTWTQALRGKPVKEIAAAAAGALVPGGLAIQAISSGSLPGSGVAKKLSDITHSATPAGLAMTSSLARTASAGAANRLFAEGAERVSASPPGVDRSQSMEELEGRHPYASTAGMILGALTPGGLPALMYRGGTKLLAPAGTKLLGRLAAGAATGSAVNPALSVAEDVTSGNPISVEKALASGFLGGGLSVLGELGSSLAGRLATRLRAGPKGPRIADLEQAGGGTSVVRGYKPPPRMAAAEERALGEGQHLEDSLISKVEEPISTTALRRQTVQMGRDAAENVDYFASKEGLVPRPVSNLYRQVSDEIAKLHDSEGNLLPGQAGALRELRSYQSEITAATAREADRIAAPARKFNAEELTTEIRRLKELASPKGAPAWRGRLLEAAMRDRDTFPKAGEAVFLKGQTPVGGYGGMRARHKLRMDKTIATNQAAGLPKKLVPKPDPRGAPAQLSEPESQAFRNTIAGSSEPLRASSKAALKDLAADAGVLDELNLFYGSKAYRSLKDADQPRAFIGSGGRIGAYANILGGAISSRADPLMRGLAKPLPEGGAVVEGGKAAGRISARLYRIVQGLVKSRGKDIRKVFAESKRARPARGREPSLMPLDEIRYGARAGKPGGASARQLGQVGGAIPIARLTPDERAALRYLVEQSQEPEEARAAGGTR